MKLPSVFANKIEKNIKNNVDVVHGTREVRKKDINELKSYFDNNGYANRLNVSIRTKNGVSNEKLILCKKDYFITINNERIGFDDILDFEVKK